MRTDEHNDRHLIADEGKVLRRVSDGWIAGTEIHIGYTYYIGSEGLADPLLELPEHYEEVYDLGEVTNDVFDVAAPPEMVALMSEDPIPDEAIPKTEERPTLVEILGRALVEIEGLKREVSELRKGVT